jgi:hypothetical protein
MCGELQGSNDPDKSQKPWAVFTGVKQRLRNLCGCMLAINNRPPTVQVAAWVNLSKTQWEPARV